MNSEPSVYRRIRRRETHSPRSVAAIALAVVLILTFAWLAVEVILSMVDRSPLVAAPSAMATALVEVTSLPTAVLIGAGVVLALLGVVLVALALAPGRRARHLIESTHSVTVVDDEVIASALARRAASAADIDPDQVRVTVSHRRADVRLTPTSGFPIDRTAVLGVVTDELDSYALEPAVRTPRLSVTAQGTVGA